MAYHSTRDVVVQDKPLDLKNFLMRGTSLQHTENAIGVVVYTGDHPHNTCRSATRTFDIE